MKHMFSISTVSVTALVILTSSFVSPLTASAQERSIAVQPKIKTFKVNDTAEEVVVPKNKNRPKIQEFRVDDGTSANDDSQQAESTPPKRPDRPQVKRFRVEDENEQAAEAIADDVDVSQLKPEFKPKAPQPQILDDESTFDNAEDSSEEAVNPDVYVGRKVYHVRYPRRYVSYNTYRHVKRYNYGYSTNYSGSSCNNNNGY